MTARSARHHNALNWFEIPVRDLDHAQRFYEAVLGKPLRRESMGLQTLAVLPYSQPGVGDALIAEPPLRSLAAWCETREDFRSFRLDRLESINILDERFRDEPGRTLADLQRRYGLE